MNLETAKERLRRAEVEVAIRKVAGVLPETMVADCVLRGQKSLTVDAGGQWLSSDGRTAGDVVSDFRKQYHGGGTTKREQPRADVYEEAKQAGDVRGMVENAPTV